MKSEEKNLIALIIKPDGEAFEGWWTTGPLLFIYFYFNMILYSKKSNFQIGIHKIMKKTKSWNKQVKFLAFGFVSECFSFSVACRLIRLKFTKPISRNQITATTPFSASCTSKSSAHTTASLRLIMFEFIHMGIRCPLRLSVHPSTNSHSFVSLGVCVCICFGCDL